MLKHISAALLAASLFVQSTSAFTDSYPSDWSYQAIQELSTKYGVLAGYPDGSFKPKANITREETAALLYRLAMWAEANKNTIPIDDLRRMQALIEEYHLELTQLQNEVRSVRQDQQVLRQRIDDVDARLDWNTKNRGLVHMTAMTGGKIIVGAGKDILSVGKGAVWLFTLGKVNLFENTGAPPDPSNKQNRYNGPVQVFNGSGL